jgi:hypothetical protein
MLSALMVRQLYHVEACVAPGVRKWVTSCHVKSVADAFCCARAYHGDKASQLCAFPVKGGYRGAVIWETIESNSPTSCLKVVIQNG